MNALGCSDMDPYGIEMLGVQSWGIREGTDS